MNKPNDGGPAFPWEQSPGNQNNLGLSKREWYAGMALIGIMLRPATVDVDFVADLCFITADAMLKRGNQ